MLGYRQLAQQRRALADGYWWKVAEAALATLGRPEISAVLLAAIGSGKVRRSTEVGNRAKTLWLILLCEWGIFSSLDYL